MVAWEEPHGDRKSFTRRICAMKIYNDINEFIKLKPSKFNFLQQIKFTRDIKIDSYSSYSAEIILCQLANSSVKKLFIVKVSLALNLGILKECMGCL